MMKPAFEVIVKKYIRLVYFFAKKSLSSQEDIDDVVQETFAKAMKSYSKFTFTTEGELKSWLLTVCRNVIVDTVRAHKHTFSLELDDIEVMDSENHIEQWIEEEADKQDTEKIQQELQKMKPIEQELIRLRIFEEMEFKQIAVALGAKEAAVKMRYYRAIQQLKETVL